MLDLLKNPDHWKATRSREERYTFSVEFDLSPRYNIALTQQVLTIGQTREGERKAATGAASASSCGGQVSVIFGELLAVEQNPAAPHSLVRTT